MEPGTGWHVSVCMNKMKPTGPVAVDAEVEHVTHVPQATVVLLHTTVSPNVAAWRPACFHDTTTTVASKLTYSRGPGSYVSRSGRVSYPPGPRTMP